jgi:hypothetical protein
MKCKKDKITIVGNTIYINFVPKKLCCAKKVFNVDHESISQNENEYWIDDCLFGYEIRINKDSILGRRLLKKIKNKKTTKFEFDNFFGRIVYSNIG